MKKPKDFTEEQRKLLARHGMDPAEHEIVKDYTYSMILRNKYSGEYKIVHKV